MIKKQVVTLAVNNYSPEIEALTQPSVKKWAEKIGADYKVIRERKFPDRSPNYEKFQLYEMAKDYDWTIFVDVDALIPEDMFDPTEYTNKDVVIFNDTDMYGHRFKANDYVRRHGGNNGACTWFVICSDWTRDCWKPIELQDDITFEEALEQVYPIQLERNFGIDKKHLVDDYMVSRNIAKYGLKVKTLVNDFYPALRCPPILNHIFLDTKADKILFLKEKIEEAETKNGSYYADKPRPGGKTISNVQNDHQTKLVTPTEDKSL